MRYLICVLAGSPYRRFIGLLLIAFHASTVFAQIDPEVLDIFDRDELARLTSEVSGVPTTVLRSADAVAAVRAQRRQQEQEAMAIQAAQPIAGAMKDAAQANQLLQGA